MKVCIGRHMNGITINPLEWALDDNNKLMEFNSEADAKQYLKSHGFSDEAIYSMIIEPV